MKMLGFMVVLTLFYWFMATQAQTLIAATEPCAATASMDPLEPSGSIDRSASDILPGAGGADQMAVAGEGVRLYGPNTNRAETTCAG